MIDDSSPDRIEDDTYEEVVASVEDPTADEYQLSTRTADGPPLA
ncbi:hypothetical protein [Streptomyces sp. NBC_01334]|nr:hypothetical protein OG736_46505 [Streptomyces sp. NBC_01334]